MSLDFIHTFQLKILNNLETLVREHVNQVYISVIEDGNYPFISINLVNSKITQKLCNLYIY